MYIFITNILIMNTVKLFICNNILNIILYLIYIKYEWCILSIIYLPLGLAGLDVFIVDTKYRTTKPTINDFIFFISKSEKYANFGYVYFNNRLHTYI